MKRSRILFDRAPDSTPHDLGGHLGDWQTHGICPAPIHGQRWPARQWGPTHAESGGWNAADPANAFHGTRGLTARFLARPNYEAALNQTIALLYRGLAGPAQSQLWAYGFLLVVRSTHIDLLHTSHTAEGQHIWTRLGVIGRPPADTPLFLSFVLDGSQADVYCDGRAIGSQAIAPVLYTTDVPMAIGHRYSASAGSQARWRGSMEYVELDDVAGTPDSERHRYEALMTGAELAADTVRVLAPIAGPNYDRYRIRPLADRIAEIEAACTRLEQAATPPRAYGAVLEQWECAVNSKPAPADDVATRQAKAWEAAQAPIGHQPADISAYAASLYGVPTDDVEILETPSWYPVATRAADLAPDGIWIHRGDIRMTADGLRIRHPAGQVLGDGNPAYAYIAFDHDESRGRSQNAFSCRLVNAQNSRANHQVGIFLAHTSTVPSHWITVRDASGWSVQLATRQAPWAYDEQLIKTLSSPQCTITLCWQNGELVIQIAEPSSATAEHRLSLPQVDRIGFGILGHRVIPFPDVTAVWTDVEVLAADSGVSYQAHAYHPSPAIRRPFQHTALLSKHGRATCRITAAYSRELRCDDENSMLDLTPLSRE